MQPHQQRVVDEKKELDEKRSRLADFFDKPGAIFASLPKEERFRLKLQAKIMEMYSEVLGERIAAF